MPLNLSQYPSTGYLVAYGLSPEQKDPGFGSPLLRKNAPAVRGRAISASSPKQSLGIRRRCTVCQFYRDSQRHSIGAKGYNQMFGFVW